MKKINRFNFILMPFLLYVVETNAEVNNYVPAKIICIGDSVTQGGSIGRPEFTYRLPLQKLISKNSFKADFVGVKKEGLHRQFAWPSYFDPDHEGFYGKKSAFIRNALKIDLSKIEPPNIAIIHIGTNDRDSITWTPIIRPNIDIIRQLRAKNPNVKILIVQIPGKTKYFFTHTWVRLMTKVMTTRQSPIDIIDLNSYWKGKYHTFDGVHPNPAGQELLAKLIFSKLIVHLK